MAVDRRSLLTQQEYMALTEKDAPEAFGTDGHFKGCAACQQGVVEPSCMLPVNAT